MRKASFRGVSFYVVSNEGENGRDIAVHNYPLRDSTWVEDLGRSQRRYAIRGFLLGQNYIAQKQLLQLAVEQAGPGLLSHPFLGLLQVSVTGYKWHEPDNTRNRIDVDLNFIEYSNPVAGLISHLTNSLIDMLSDGLADTAVGDFLKNTSDTLHLGMMNKAVSVASEWGGMVFAQGTGTIPIAALSSIGVSNIGNGLLDLAVNREKLKQILQTIDPRFDQKNETYLS